MSVQFKFGTCKSFFNRWKSKLDRYMVEVWAYICNVLNHFNLFITFIRIFLLSTNNIFAPCFVALLHLDTNFENLVPVVLIANVLDMIELVWDTQGWGLLNQFLPFRYFPNLSALFKQTLAIEYHVFDWSCGDTCQIWMWFNESNCYFCKIESFAYGEIKERSLSNPHPWMDFLYQPKICF